MTRIEAETQPPISTRYRSLAGVHVLTLTDSPDEREMLAVVFGQCGARVTSVASTMTALIALRGSSPDVLVCALDFSDLDARSLMRELRGSNFPEGRDTPVVALTPWDEPTLSSDAAAPDAGFQRTFAKPVRMAVLVAAIADLASGRSREHAGARAPRAPQRGPRRRLLKASKGPVAAPDWSSSSD